MLNLVARETCQKQTKAWSEYTVLTEALKYVIAYDENDILGDMNLDFANKSRLQPSHHIHDRLSEHLWVNNNKNH